MFTVSNDPSFVELVKLLHANAVLTLILYLIH